MEKFFLEELNGIRICELLKSIKYNDEDIIFIGGSLVEAQVNSTSKGMGNRLSDLDMFILTSDLDSFGTSKLDYDRRFIKTRFKKVKGLHIDIEIVDMNIFIETLNQIKKIKFIESVRSTNLLNLEENSMKMFSVIHRFINSIPLHNHVAYKNLRNELDLDNYFNYKKRIVINIIDNMYSDAVGNLECGQYEVANYIARKILVSTLESYLYFNHISLDREKWILLLFKNLSRENEKASEYYRKFTELYFETSLKKSSDYEKNSKEMLKLSNDIIDYLGGI